MKYIAALLATATPALAHSGAHLHPHEANSALPLMAALAVIVAAGFAAFLWSRK
ncbi:hypothetical protein KUV47_01545 [Vannielia litorea]|uniref:hypothetical protein n=1 Tax=Vannielia litorea TaxID=1217970 RepID=UPI001C985024|nr:hypothetical protein [Vannielia litorea]MBY6048218.1 hypothetical protein [Vannielia litorea]MBY6075632.1 hypothetical protein [Vannielia litorea]MBY6151880.1 hypothetical protein [Vannielia litorea]